MTQPADFVVASFRELEPVSADLARELGAEPGEVAARCPRTGALFLVRASAAEACELDPHPPVLVPREGPALVEAS